jgi:hypothetical protein
MRAMIFLDLFAIPLYKYVRITKNEILGRKKFHYLRLDLMKWSIITFSHQDLIADRYSAIYFYLLDW